MTMTDHPKPVEFFRNAVDVYRTVQISEGDGVRSRTAKADNEDWADGFRRLLDWLDEVGAPKQRMTIVLKLGAADAGGRDAIACEVQRP